MSAHQIWAAVATVFTVVAAVTILSLFGKDASGLLLVIAAVVTPIVTAMFLKQDLTKVKEQLNGHLADLTKKIPDADKEA